MRVRLGLMTVLAVAVFTAFTVSPATAAAARPGSGTGVPLALQGVTCTGPNAPCTVTGTLTGFTSQAGQLVAQVLVTVTDATGATASQTIGVPVLAANGTCQILHLELGPLDLNLLGLHVTTNRIVLDITGERGPGNLLGNLLCGVAGVLDSNASTNALATLLNRLLGL